MCKYIYAKQGHVFIPTETAPPHVYGKYKEGYSRFECYKGMCPEKWVKEGWVKEIEDMGL